MAAFLPIQQDSQGDILFPQTHVKTAELFVTEIKHNVEIIWLRWENGQRGVIGHVMYGSDSEDVASDGGTRVVNNPSCRLKCSPADSHGHPPL